MDSNKGAVPPSMSTPGGSNQDAQEFPVGQDDMLDQYQQDTQRMMGEGMDQDYVGSQMGISAAG